MASINYVGALKEYADKRGLVVTYEDVGCVGEDHNRTFTMRAVLGGKVYPDGVGSSKKEAKRKAAENALMILKEGHPDATENVSDTSTSAVVPAVRTNFMCWLNEYSQKNAVSFRPVEAPKCGPNLTTQWCSFVVADKEYPGAYGRTKKEAREKAAKQVYNDLCGIKTTESGVKEISGTANQPRQDLNQPVPYSADSGCAKSSIPATPSDSVAFTNSSKPPKEQVQSPNVKPKIKLAANFGNVDGKSIEDMPNFKWGKDKHIEREKASAQPTHSRFISDFDSVECLGKGAFGCVFKAKQKLTEKYFAVKIVRCKETALREVEALSELLHPNIVRYYTCWLEDSDYQWESLSGSSSMSESSREYSGNYLYIKMELCDVRTLRLWIDEKNLQNVKKSLRDSKRRNESLTFALQIVSGVEYIHSKALFHRDLKPANIMFGTDGEMKIGDFGLVVTESSGSDNSVERSVYKGTPSYMAPEQKDKKTYDRKVDIFALGLTYFEMLWNMSTGHERAEIWRDARNQKLPLEFCQRFGLESVVIKSMLHINPEERPEASQLKAQLEKCRDESEVRERRTC
ncbi:unnamed protein product [Ophioblennius macclurei]